MKLVKKSVLLTGATGFLGSHILESLISCGEYQVICLKRSFSDIRRIKHLSSPELIFYDLDKSSLGKIFAENRIDIILHTATEYGRRDNSIHQVLSTNLLFPIEIIDVAIKHKVKCFINTDSFFNKSNFSYSHLLDYSLSKKSLLTWMKHLSGKMQFVNVILEHIYGENDNIEKFVEKMIQSIAVKHDKAIDLTYGHQRRDFIYIKDVVSAYLKIIDFSIKEKFTYRTFEVGIGESTEVREFVETIKKCSKSNTKLNFGSIPYFSDEIMDSKANINEITQLGWIPNYSIVEGISETLNHYKKLDNE